MTAELPEGLEHARTTDVFDESTVPPGLRRQHQIAENRWGRIVVHAGAMRLVFEDAAGETVELSAGDRAVIPPQRPHHVELGDGARFAVEFHRPPAGEQPAPSEQ